MAPEAHGDTNAGSSTMEAERNKKPRKRKKSRASSSAAKSSTSSSLPVDGDGSGAGQQRRQLAGEGQKQQQLYRGKPRVIWTPELHNKFLKACNALGEDAVPKKILALMDVDWISRENVASHLQKHRLSLKREEQLMPGKVNQRPLLPPLHAEASSSPTTTPMPSMPGKVNQRPLLPLHAEASSPTTTPMPSLHPPAQAPASSSLHPLPPSQAPFSAHTMSPIHIGHSHQHLLQTPPGYCFSSSNAAPTTSLLLHPHPCFIPTVQPIQQLFTLPLDVEATAIATRRKLFEKQRVAGRAAAAASGYNDLMIVRNDVVVQASHSVSMAGESTVPKADVMRYEGEEGQGRAAERGAAEEMAPKAGEGQVQAAEPRTAAAGSSSPHGSSIHEQYWKIDDDITDVSWDFCGIIPWRKTG